MSTDKNIWFKAKKYGWGWIPAMWQGWLTVMTVISIAICYARGEKPSWKWGEKR